MIHGQKNMKLQYSYGLHVGSTESIKLNHGATSITAQCTNKIS